MCVCVEWCDVIVSLLPSLYSFTYCAENDPHLFMHYPYITYIHAFTDAKEAALSNVLPLPKDWMASASTKPGHGRSLLVAGDLPLPKDWLATQNNLAYGSYPWEGHPPNGGGENNPPPPAGGRGGQPGGQPNGGGGQPRKMSAVVSAVSMTEKATSVKNDDAYGPGSYPYTDEPDHYGNGGSIDHDHDHDNDNGDYPDARGGAQHHDKMAEVPGGGAKDGNTLKTHPVRSLETIMFKKAKDDQQTRLYLRGRQSSL